MTTPRTHSSTPDLDPSLRDLERSLDRLGAAERASAPESLDDRILRATRPLLAGGSQHRAARPPMLARIFTPSRLIPVTAAVAIAALVGISAMTMSRSANTGAALATAEAQLDALLADAAPQESSATVTAPTSLVLGDALVDVRASIAAAEQSLDDFWAIPDDSDPLATTLETSL